MRKDRFLEQFAEHLPYLRVIAQKTGLDYDNSCEVVSQCFEAVLSAKRYTSVESSKLKAFLSKAVVFASQHHKRDELRRSIDCARLPDPDVSYMADSKVEVEHRFTLDAIDETECPFCFQANLNEYGACMLCHTIVPSHRRVQRNVITMTEESLAVAFDFNTKIDVQNAIAKLTPFEQQVVIAIGTGRETLDSFGEISTNGRMSIWRTWVEAKAKLQEYLSEYAPEGLSKRGENAFRKAAQSIEKARQFEG
jgi:hypothetical protein